MISLLLRLGFVCAFLLSNVDSMAQYFGGSNNDNGISFCQQNGQLLLTGTTRSFGAGSDDFWIVRANSSLEVVDHYTWGGRHRDVPAGISATADNGFLVTGYSTDEGEAGINIVLSKFSADGHIQWSSYFGGATANDFVHGIRQTIDKGYLITGINRGQGTNGAIFLIKTDAKGVLQWEQFYDTESRDIGMDVAQSEDGDMFLLANTNAFHDKVANSSEYISKEASKAMVIKIAVDGKELWRKFFGGIKHDMASKIMADDAGGCYFVGSSRNNTNGSFDMTLHRIDGDGELLWRKNYGGAGYEYGNDLDLSAAGNVLLTGTSSSFSEGEAPDIYVVLTDRDGTEIWSKTLGGSETDEGNCGRFLSDGNIGVLGGSKSGGKADWDFYFMRLTPEGEELDVLNGTLGSTTTEPILFPNPATTTIQVYMGDNFDQQPVEVQLIDMSGKPVKQWQFTGPFNVIELDNALSPGAYIYHIDHGGSSTRGKLILH